MLDSGADLISYGMGEHSLLEIAEGLAAGISVSDLTYIRGTVFKTRDRSLLDPDGIELPPFEEIKADKKTYARSFYIQYCNTDPYARPSAGGMLRRRPPAWCRIRRHFP